MHNLLLDIRYAFRSFARQPALTFVAVLSLGLGIGATSTVFTWLQGFVLNPLPAVPGWDRLVAAHTRAPGGGFWSVSWPDFQDWRAGARSVDLAAWDIMQLGLRDGSGPTERAWGMVVSGNYFEDLHVRAALGRVLRMDDEQRRAPVAVLGHGFWQRHFAGDSSVIGRTITLNGSAFTIVGVAAPRFGGTYIALSLHLYVPMTTIPLLTPDGAQLLQDRLRRSIEVVGRLKPEATVAQAAAEVEPLALRAGAAGGLAQPLGAVVRRHSDVDAPSAMRPVLGALLAVAGLVLLIACANVANLLLARAVARRREVAVRLAVGASRYRLVRQLLTESLALAALAGVFGLVVTSWGRDAMLALLPAVPYPVGLDFRLDGRVLLFATLVTAATAMAFGLVPALQASNPDLVRTLKDEIGEGTGGRGRLQAALVVTQVALSLVTLVSAGLFMRSLEEYRSIDSGMTDLDRVLLAGTDLRLSGITGDSVQVSVVRGLLERVRALPGVEAASVARSVVLGPGPVSSSATRIEGYTPRPNENMNVSHNDVAGDYFRTTGIRLIEGRDLSDADVSDNAPVVVVNEAFVRRYLAGRSAIGARVNMGGEEWLSIVGVVVTSKVNDYTEDPLPMVFRAYSARFAPPAFTLHVRAAGDPLALTAVIRGAFAEVSAELPFLDPRNMAEFTTIPYWPQKIGAIMLAAVGTLALLLAAIGIYATMAYTVSRRVREIGVRIALGAARKQVIGMVVGRGMRLTALGLLIGLVFAGLVGQALRSQLLGVSPRDPLTFAGVGLLLAAVALAACVLPARRAARVDPMVALRSG
ncbi:MAG: ABC transporter permease [Gemmatimonadales bacterium]|nr:ABC transporter permease [Gemmatimonadales bacterium]